VVARGLKVAARLRTVENVCPIWSSAPFSPAENASFRDAIAYGMGRGRTDLFCLDEQTVCRVCCVFGMSDALYIWQLLEVKGSKQDRRSCPPATSFSLYRRKKTKQKKATLERAARQGESFWRVPSLYEINPAKARTRLSGDRWINFSSLGCT
jgi:hypothetical protein